LLAAAAQRWNVDVNSLRSSNGQITDGTRSVTYGDLAALAATLPLPQNVSLKDPAQFKYIGHAQHRLDGPDKVTGRAQFGMDVDLPDMLTAVVARAPVFGGKLVSFDATATRGVSGVVDVRQVPSGVAVYASNTWSAMRGRDALKLNWDEGASAGDSTDTLRAKWRQLLGSPGSVATNQGDVQLALASAAQRIDVEYELPYLAHACMEPLNCTAHVTPEGCEIWVGTQHQSMDQQDAAKALGIEPSAIIPHDPQSFGLAQGNGQMIFEVAPKSKSAEVLNNLAEIIAGTHKPVKAKKLDLSGFMQKLPMMKKK
jgi:isoquinoline 1-oxidoreductase beta subunit